MRRVEGRMWAVYLSASGTVLIAAGAFWLSFVALADLARRSGIASAQAWIWPLLVDGLIVVATVAAVALDGRRAAWYPWTLLILGALVRSRQTRSMRWSLPIPPPVHHDLSSHDADGQPVGERDRRAADARMRREHGWSNKRIARELGVHASTVGRWLPRPTPPNNPEPADAAAGAVADSTLTGSPELTETETRSPIKEYTP
ncbi:DUF2637 domain-containing protein [Microbacterium sp. YY-01]|uniref:DUF2637 domain-containing protein n=1 Tax=Microbacterium sp. YY-01 TaxID=3421634 RepID=UPI003D1742FA